MIQQRNTVDVSIKLILLIYLQTTCLAERRQSPCPIGYNIAYSNDKEVCYRIKGPEKYKDIFKNCPGNIFTSRLYHSLDLTRTGDKIWTEFRSAYPGGPFIDTSYSDDAKQKPLETNDVYYDPSLGINEELCVIIDPVTNFTAVNCNGDYKRFCFLEPYIDKEYVTNEGCEKLSDAKRFWSPVSTCLTAVKGVNGGAVRATWHQSQELCERKGGSLLSRGWRYSNYELFRTGSGTYPLGVVFDPEHNILEFALDGNDMIPKSEWNFEDENFSNDTSLGMVEANFWYLVNSSFIFYDVICERSVQLRHVHMNVSIDIDNKITLAVNDTVSEGKIICYTDSLRYYPETTIVSYDAKTGLYIIKPHDDGYYWCVLTDTKKYTTSESNKALYIREKESLIHIYAVKLQLKNKYKFDEFKKNTNNLKKLKEYIFYSTEYNKMYGTNNSDHPTGFNETLFNFKRDNPTLKRRDKIIDNFTKKQLYLDQVTALIHVKLYPDMMPVVQGFWADMYVHYMKPVYYCPEQQSPYNLPRLRLGESRTTPNCVIYSCVGDFNNGVQWVITTNTTCTPIEPVPLEAAVDFADKVTQHMPTIGAMDFELTTREIVQREPRSEEPPEVSTVHTTVEYENTVSKTSESSSEESSSWATASFTESHEVITVGFPTKPPKPTTTTEAPTTGAVITETPIIEEPTTRPPPEQQLQQVMEDLGNLVNTSEPLMVANITDAFRQVDELLADQEELEIPGELLNLLDEIGSRIDLNGTDVGSTVKQNIALLIADAQPDLPVMGLRIAARENSFFSEEAFEIIREEVNSTHLSSDTSEVVVQLPQSLGATTRRISFVVFRNDRAFRSHDSQYAVNSLVLSIKVENVTEFQSGEVIDINLSPLTDQVERNQSRTCAFWHFLDDRTGYWSQEGCTFIRATQANMLDTCRCNHLTHFAEILIPRTVFTEKQEDMLQVISVIGCCFSIFGLFVVGLTAALFRSWRREFTNKIWLQLCISILILSICFLITVYANFGEHDVTCMLVGVALHYSLLVSFCWMLVAAVLSYRRLVTVFNRDASHKLLRAAAFSWGVPCAVVGILLSVDPQSYAGRFEDKSPGGAFCYPSGLALWLSVYAPIAVMLLANWTLFVLIVRSVFASRRIQRHGDSNEAFRCASVSCLLVFLFGLPWVFGLFSTVVTATFFAILATFQGFVLFVFFVIGNKKTRDLWLNKLKIKQTRKVPVTSSTYTNRSTGNVGGRVGGAGAIEAKSSKPRSLATPDDTRFS